MENKIKESLETIKIEIEQLQEIENSLLLAKVFYDLKKLLQQLNVPKLEINKSIDRKETNNKYIVSYRTEDGHEHKNLFKSLYPQPEKTSSIKFIELDDYDGIVDFLKIVKLLEKENIKLKPITKDLTVEDFLFQFNKKHSMNYLSHFLKNNKENKEKKLKI